MQRQHGMVGSHFWPSIPQAHTDQTLYLILRDPQETAFAFSEPLV